MNVQLLERAHDDLARELLRADRVTLADGLRDLDVKRDGRGVGVLEHDLVVSTAREDLGDHVTEPGEHLVARRVQDDPVEGDVVDEIPLQLVAA